MAQAQAARGTLTETPANVSVCCNAPSMRPLVSASSSEFAFCKRSTPRTIAAEMTLTLCLLEIRRVSTDQSTNADRASNVPGPVDPAARSRVDRQDPLRVFQALCSGMLVPAVRRSEHCRRRDRSSSAAAREDKL